MSSWSTLELVKLGLLALIVVLSISMIVGRRRGASGSWILTGRRAHDMQLVALILVVLATLPVSKPAKEILRGSCVLAQLITVWLIVRAPRPARPSTAFGGDAGGLRSGPS